MFKINLKKTINYDSNRNVVFLSVLNNCNREDKVLSVLQIHYLLDCYLQTIKCIKVKQNKLKYLTTQYL